jgi:cytochrome P450
MSMIPTERAPTSTLDPYEDQALLNPWPLYRELRKMRPVVWLEKYGMFALTRYDVVAKALRDWEAFPSSFGVMMNDDITSSCAATRCVATRRPQPIAPCGNPAGDAGTDAGSRT